MKIIGITGGIGSGKTAVLDIMQRDYGAFIMEADALAHRLMEPGFLMKTAESTEQSFQRSFSAIRSSSISSIP